jgi:hypothetical protein
VAIALSGAAAALRVFQRFRRFGASWIFSSWYTWSFIGFAAVLTAAAYTGLAGLMAAIGGSMVVPQIAGASGMGHGLLALGRLGRSGKKPNLPGEVESAKYDVAGVNQLLDFFYTGVRIHVQERMHIRAKELAREFDFAIIRKVTCELLENEVDTRALSAPEGEKTIRKIRALSPSRDSAEDLSYDALRWTIVSASYGQLNSRLAGEQAKRRP